MSSLPPARRQAVRIDDVAAAAGVSKALVSYALNGRPGVKDSTRDRIIEIAQSMGWTPSLRGRSLSASRAFAVGLTFRADPEELAGDPYYTSLMVGLQSVLFTAGYSLMTEVVDARDAQFDAMQRMVQDGRVDGVILTDLAADDPRVGLVRDTKVPFVSLGPMPDAFGMPALVYDETPAIADAVAHLLALGHRDIAQVVGPQSSAPARLRAEVYRQQLRAHGLDDSRVEAGDYTAASGKDATVRLLEQPDPPTAILYSNDLMAIAGMSVAAARGLRVPDDLSVIGWDDITVSQYLHPALTTMREHPFDDGKAAAASLLQAIAGTRFDEPIRMPDPVFVLRDSTAPAPR